MVGEFEQDTLKLHYVGGRGMGCSKGKFHFEKKRRKKRGTLVY